jgi:hypothetical protein
MNEEQVVTFKILDTSGFSVQKETPEKALAMIKEYLERKGGWFYLDKVVTHIGTTTVEDLKNASIVTITNVIIGGVDNVDGYATIINF